MDNWSEIKYINFTYSSPNEDVESCMGLNPDGNINVRYTLTTLRDKLMENVQTLNKLLEKSDHITGMFAMDYNSVAICISSQEEMDNMFKNGLIRNEIIYPEEPEEDDDDISDESDHETHSDRLRMMKNLIFSSESRQMSDSDDESSENDFVDAINMEDLVRKYDGLIGEDDEDTD